MRWTDKMEEIKGNEITLREFYDKLDSIHKDIYDIKIQTTKTNGRVTSCETTLNIHNSEIKSLEECNKNQDKEINKLIWKVGLIVSIVTFIISKLTGLFITI